MKNNFFSSKKPKIGFIALLLFFCGLFANTAMAQSAVANNDTFIWTGTNSSSWNDAGNWSVLRGTTTAGTNNYPGEVGAIDIVYVNKSDAPNAPILDAQTRNIIRLFVSNDFGGEAGATLTINSGATLNVGTGTASNFVVLTGGNIINNGALNINATGVGFTNFPAYGINCGNPPILPTIPRQYGYSGSGTLSINLSAANFANSAAIAVIGNSGATATPTNNANVTYRLVMNNPSITLNQASTATINVIRANGGNNANKLIIGGTGFTIGTVGTPSIGSLISLGGGASVTVESGTTLTLNSAIANTNTAITGFSSSTFATNLTNKGTINIQGATARSGMGFSTGASGTASVFNISNEGILNVDLNAVAGGTSLNSALIIGNGGGGAVNIGSAVNVTNTGTMTLKNTSTAVGTGFAIFTVSASEAAPLFITNNGVLNLEGTTYNFGLKTTINNNAIINSNSEFRSFVAVNNNIGGSINFVRTAATATTRPVTFTITTSTDISGAIGSIYKDSNNNEYSVVVQKFSGGTNLVTNVLSGATIPTSGTLTRVSTGTGSTSIAYTAVSIPPLNNALPSTTTNSGTINTDTASNLNIISGVTTTSTSVIAPGGSAGKGIADFAKATAALTGKTILQISGDTTAGVDYDQITNSTVGGSFSVGGTLDVTGIYTPAGPATIDIVTTEATGTLTGAFNSNVIGITTGWSVVTTTGTGGKIQLVYSATTPTATTWTGGTSTGWIDASNWLGGIVPDQNSDVTIGTGAFQPSPFVNVSIKSLTIDSGASLTLNPTYNFTVKEAITNNGTLTVLNNANLIQVDNVANGGSGNAVINRNSNALSRLDYTIWSSPVTGAQTLAGFSPLTSQSPSRFYNYSETGNQYAAIASPTTTTFDLAAGYLIRMPNDHPTSPTVWAGSFSGVPNNGTINKALTYNGSAPFGYNMVGNPYPSTIDAQAFITANTTNIESSLYFWRKINGATGSSYAVYNPLGATTATPSSAVPNGTIQVGQGFFVKAKSASNVSFTNAMRVANNSNQFFKTKQVQKDRLWLNLTSAADAFSQTLVGYTADATLAVDMFDAKYINDSPIALTSSINNEEYTIQGRPAFDATDVVALNFKTDVAGAYSIALDHFDGVFAAGQDVYLLDNTTGAETNLKNGSYTFNAAAGIDNSRFTLKYQKTLKVAASAFNDSVSVYKNNGTLYVNSGSIAISSISVFDVQGRLLSEQRNVKANTATIKDQRALNQVLIVKIVGEDNSEVTKKVLN
jgi:trimeric autotransporter adhesin